MAKGLFAYRIIAKHFQRVVFQNTITLINSIFFIVSVLLLVFHEAHEALFLIVVLVLNIGIGIVQDLRAKVALEQLQILMTPRIVRVDADRREQVVTSEEVREGDVLKIVPGDQIPADGELTTGNGLEINEALLTGESDSKARREKQKVLAGSIVTAGSGTLRVERTPQNSLVAQMTSKIKQYTLNLSPIQKTLNAFVKYMTYLLLAIVVYVVIHGLTVHEVLATIVKDIAALTSTLVPQGLILATTIFFAYGAVKMLKQQVLLQKINATEKLGRIKNLCVDKTGTLTENKPLLEQTILFDGQERKEAEEYAAGYLQATGDLSQTGNAIGAFPHSPFSDTVLDALPFSSSRKYGLAALNIAGKDVTVIMGAPDILLSHVAAADGHSWLKQQVGRLAPQGKRLVLLAAAENSADRELTQKTVLRPLVLFALSNPLRPGTTDIIAFFQNRGVSVRVISGDNPQTVQTIARQAGIKHTDLIVTGREMEQWDEEVYRERVPAYHLFARISPEQKEKIISMLKLSGFTAMVGDGANDALAIKRADLGIAMFQGAQATRQIAEIILMNNSFAALPAGVTTAETIITNIEVVASVFFNSVIIGLALFFILALLGYIYPLSPRNTTIINYVILWLPLFYWAMFPAHSKGRRKQQSFLKRVLPFSILNGLLTAVAAFIVFIIGPEQLKTVGSNILVVLVAIGLGYWFFLLTPLAYGLAVEKKERKIAYAFGGAALLFLALALTQPVLSNFFGLQPPEMPYLIFTVSLIFLFGFLQYRIARYWFYPKALAALQAESTSGEEG